MSKLWYSVDIFQFMKTTPVFTAVFSTSTSGNIIDVYPRVNTNVFFINVLITPNPSGGSAIYNPLWKQFNLDGVTAKIDNETLNNYTVFQFNFFSLDPFQSNGVSRYYYLDNGITKTFDVPNTVSIKPISQPTPSNQTTLLFQFPANFVFRFVNAYFFAIDWGDGTNIEFIKSGTLNSYHKYKTSKIYKVTFFSIKNIPYTLFSYPDGNNGFGYIINCPNSVNVNDNLKLYHTLNEQGYASDRIKKRKDQTIYSNLKSRNPLLKELPKTYRSYESLTNIQRGYVYCKFNSIYAFQ